MHYDFIHQQQPGAMTTGDKIALYCDDVDGYTSGCYTVAAMEKPDPEDLAHITIIGTDNTPTAGHIAVIYLE